MFFFTIKSRFILPVLISLSVMGVSALFGAESAIAAMETQFSPPDSPVKILGGDWIWEFESGNVKGTGRGGIAISWGDGIRATAQNARIERPPIAFELSGGVRVDFEDRLLFCDSLSYDESADVLVATGNVRLVQTEPAVQIESGIASYFGLGGGGARIAFAHGVLLTGEGGSRLESEEMIYAAETGFAQIEGEFRGELPLDFITDNESPFLGRKANLGGINLIVFLDGEGTPFGGAAEDVIVSTGNAEINAPDLEFVEDAAGKQILLHARDGRQVTGWYKTVHGERGDFYCDHLSISEKSGKMKLSGAVSITGEGASILSEMVSLDYMEGYYKVTSATRTKISFDDLSFLPGSE